MPVLVFYNTERAYQSDALTRKDINTDFSFKVEALANLRDYPALQGASEAHEDEHV